MRGRCVVNGGRWTLHQRRERDAQKATKVTKSKFVSTKPSLILAVIAWSALIFVLFGFGYWDASKR